jgi:hypothetical protein
MTMSTANESLVTEETQQIEQQFRTAGYADVQAYRAGPFALRLRVRDSRFRGSSRTARMQILTPLIRALPEETQADLIFVLPIAPGEERGGSYLRMNEEFEHPRVFVTEPQPTSEAE